MMDGLGTALITGASSGIGAVYADRLARRGHDLILVARDRARLDAMAARLGEAHGRRVEVVAADLTDRTQLAPVERRLADDPAITLLVNNAGMSLHGGWLTADIDELEAMVALNAVAPMRLARAAARAFAARGAGAIVNVASVLSQTPEHSDGAYSATKAFVLNLSFALAATQSAAGVYTQAVLPGATRTEIFARSGKDIAAIPVGWMMEVDDMVDAALAGFDRREAVTIPSLHDAALWDAMVAARRALVPHLQNNVPAARYRRADGKATV